MVLIAAVDAAWGIGKDGDLLKRISADMKFFRSKTQDHVLIIGRKTLESFPGKKPLPGRKNIVLTKQKDYSAEGCSICHSKKDVLELLGEAGEEVFVAGGESIYREFLADCDTVFLTKIYAAFPADRSFPNLDEGGEFSIVWESEVQEEKGIRYQFFQYVRN